MNHEDQRIIALLDELLEYTIQLSQVEANPDTDVEFLTRVCRERLLELQKIRPGSLADSKYDVEDPHRDLTKTRITEALKKLDIQTKQCLDVLLRCRNRTETELASLRQTGKAIRAYGGGV